jgi:uncharacterized protein (DUF885 family)
MKNFKFLAVAPLAFLFLSCATHGVQDVGQRRSQLNALLDEQWQYILKMYPEFASTLGDLRYNDRLSDVSEKNMLADIKVQEDYLARFEAIDTEGFPEQERLNQVLMVRQLKLNLEGSKFRDWHTPVNQMNGIHLDAPQLVQVLSFKNLKDYQDYIARLKAWPKQFDDTMENMRLGMADGNIPPKFLLEKVPAQARKVVHVSLAESPFAQPLKHFPKTISKADQAKIRTAVLDAIKNSVTPAYEKFIRFVETEYAPKGRADFGVWSIPNGETRYAYYIKNNTTTSKPPQEIHEIGLAEVTRIETEMLKIANTLGFKDLKSFNASINGNKSLRAKSRQQIVDLYTKFETQMEPKLPLLFGRLPKAKLEVRPIERYQEKESAAAFYVQGTPDGSRPGHVMVNTGDFANRKLISLESTAYHEGIPGHHMQISISQEMEGLPPFRKFGGNNAYIEGWALYAERLGEEAHFYQDPYFMYGHLQDEMLRAIRLVVDTGVHYKKWTRQQMVDFFHAHSNMDELDIQSETDRYIVWPGQALAYKTGQLKILELRQWAQRELGQKFDVRKFHDTVLGSGSLPLDVLETLVRDWVAHEKAAR